MRKIKSVEELDNLKAGGVKVVCPQVAHLSKPVAIDTFLKLSTASVLKAIRLGLYAPSLEDETPESSILTLVKDRIRATGLSVNEIAALRGVKPGSVKKFMAAKSVQTRVIDEYFQCLGI
jgi:hypothetical protein